MKKLINWRSIVVVLLLVNITLSLWALYDIRIKQAQICLAIAALHDSTLTTLTGEAYDENTVGIHLTCLGDSLFLVPGFSKRDIDKILADKKADL